MPDALVKSSSSLNACCGCKKPLGQEANCLPIVAQAADEEGPMEAWCPTCFVYQRALLEPGRWGAIAPAKCSRCGVESLLHGHGTKCGSCGSRTVIVLPRPVTIARA